MLSVSINGVVLNDEPKGLTDASIKVLRSEDRIGGTFISDLQFWGDGYAALLNIAETSDPCERIEINISGCPVEFEGITLVRDIQFNYEQCIATCAIEDNSWESRVINMRDLKVPFGLGTSLNREAISSYNGETHSFPGALAATFNRRGFRLLPSFEYIMDYLTDGNISVVADSLFTTDYRPDVYEITCVRPSTTVGTVQFSHLDMFGNEQFPNGLIGSGIITNNDYAERIARLLLSINTSQENEGKYPFEVSVTGNVISLKYFNAANLVLLDDGGTGTITIVKTQAATYGIQNAAFTGGEFLANSDEPVRSMSMSFDEITSLFSLYGIKYEFLGNQIILRKEPDTFNTTTTATLTDVPIEDISFNQPIAYKSLSFRQLNNQIGPAKEWTFRLASVTDYTGLSCAESQKEAFINFNYIYGFTWSTASQFTEDQYWLYETTPSTTTVVKYVLNAQNPITFAFEDTIRISFASGLHPFVARNNVFSNPNGFGLGNDSVLNTFSVKINKFASFEAPLTDTQMNAILANKIGRIVVNGMNGYIQEIDYNIKTGITQFQLLIE
jgi:hypothetical protein